jgi:hypothetical protein
MTFTLSSLGFFGFVFFFKETDITHGEQATLRDVCWPSGDIEARATFLHSV